MRLEASHLQGFFCFLAIGSSQASNLLTLEEAQVSI